VLLTEVERQPCNFVDWDCVLVYGRPETRPDEPSGNSEAGEIVARARAGDAEAWGDLYGEFAPAIFRFCRRALPTREDAEDATTEIFMKIRDKLNQYDTTRPFTAWLYRVSANHCWDIPAPRKIPPQDKERRFGKTLPLEHPDPNQLDQLDRKANQRGSTQRWTNRRAGAHGAGVALLLRHVMTAIADSLECARAFVGVVLLGAA
jgi:hypothetical protein